MEEFASCRPSRLASDHAITLGSPKAWKKRATAAGRGRMINERIGICNIEPERGLPPM
ncbi:hypothetical protein QA639_35460 [Bradyrhizobium pachyrhizi]|uniref:hypothetical protein n=1 Tax=Bradyrhizobium pachyrhizi TaxID=280333 RepID=UPI0024B190E4|nr:hypothetical protein [Bradyrhizobium pachyrhizi]WFU54815.1 hypothetical protein QA639_35460 [Bradyrhizobium pachyrhizi]